MDFSAVGSSTLQASVGRNCFGGQPSGLPYRYHLYLSPNSHSLIGHPFHLSAPRTVHLTSSSLTPVLLSGHVTPSEGDSIPRISLRRQNGSSSGGSQSGLCVSALPEYAGALAGVAVAASVGALVFMNQEGLSVGLKLNQLPCPNCEGSGLCPACNGDGFQNSTPSRREAAKLRAKSDTAATRYTAGLAKKWKYCNSCNGGRGCVACDGRGRVDPPSDPPQQPPPV